MLLLLCSLFFFLTLLFTFITILLLLFLFYFIYFILITLFAVRQSLELVILPLLINEGKDKFVDVSAFLYTTLSIKSHEKIRGETKEIKKKTNTGTAKEIPTKEKV